METTMALRLSCSYHVRPEVDHNFQFNWLKNMGLSNMSLNSQQEEWSWFTVLPAIIEFFPLF